MASIGVTDDSTVGRLPFGAVDATLLPRGDGYEQGTVGRLHLRVPPGAGERLHVTDKAISKWERGISYPDVTLLETLASTLGLRVEELMTCRRQVAQNGEEESMKNLLIISDDSLRRERRRSWERIISVLTLVLVAGVVIGYNALYATETREDKIVLKETAG